MNTTSPAGAGELTRESYALIVAHGSQSLCEYEITPQSRMESAIAALKSRATDHSQMTCYLIPAPTVSSPGDGEAMDFVWPQWPVMAFNEDCQLCKGSGVVTLRAGSSYNPCKCGSYNPPKTKPRPPAPSVPLGWAELVGYTWTHEIEMLTHLPKDYGDVQITAQPVADGDCNVPLYTAPTLNKGPLVELVEHWETFANSPYAKPAAAIATKENAKELRAVIQKMFP